MCKIRSLIFSTVKSEKFFITRDQPAIIIFVHTYEGESKSKGKIHLTALIAVTVSNFTYRFST